MGIPQRDGEFKATGSIASYGIAYPAFLTKTGARENRGGHDVS
jgi:hypothetical protein